VRARILRGVAALTGALALVCAAGTPASAVPSGSGVADHQRPRGYGVLAFLSDRDSTADAANDDIYVTTDLGRTVVRATTDPGLDEFPAVSADGRYLAWTSIRDSTAFPNPDGSGDLFVCRLQLAGRHPGCREVRRLTDLGAGEGAIQPRWSPRGDTLLLTLQTAQDPGDVYAVRVRDRSPQLVRLVGEPGVFDGQPTLSPDGRTLLWASAGMLWAAHADGSDPRPWTTLPASNPDFSPDGRHVVFNAARDGTDQDVYTMRARPEGDGNQAVNLTDGLLSTLGTASVDRWARYSPDGRRIAFWSANDPSPFSGETYVMDADGSDLVNISDDDDELTAQGDPVAETFLDWGGRAHR
jgi:Tol biopolymer transport system component